ncbi:MULTISPECIES: peptidoglycan recognition family protein [Streptomyces]|jgi:hypothetical protein|uniref:peptidoglycan recognition protein family protein n=1 Tax=Streptomyces TaxID=1883 RepID=UPI00190899B6|nr:MULTISPECIES: peptidoglycan recognition family protein [unclassified Streptomyces]MCU4748868.1 peptidoglycan recognition protein family protein [Streptomyces sp. G-5]QQN80311.1 N-acetylmuramoyl-L-alanine amidase [Streptomyces sp. XC 2026]
MSGADLTRRRLLLAGSAGLVAGGTALALSGTASAAPRSAPVVEPDIDSTAVWGARPASGTITVLDNRPNKIIVHHAAGPNSTDYSRAQAHAHAKWVQNIHMDDNGWSDTGYHFVVSRGGWITEGRHESLRTLRAGQGLVLGAHTSGQNYDGIGICTEGAYHDGATPPQAQWEVLVSLCAYTCQRYGIAPTQLYGHKDFNATLCPGVLHDMLPQLRSEVAAALG